jgi:D-alanyl-D-alanine dipeptidase
MTFLSPIPKSLVVPAGLPRLEPPRSTPELAASVRIGHSVESLVPIPSQFGQFVPYDELPIPARDRLVLRSGVIARLEQALAALPEPFGIAVLDGWRSTDYQRELLSYYTARFPDIGDGYVADPEDKFVLPPHTTGGAVDLTLSWNGASLALGTDYDSFADAAHVGALESERDSPIARDLRRLLSSVLRGAGFAPYPLEWWHWSYGDQWWAAEYGYPVSLYSQVG